MDQQGSRNRLIDVLKAIGIVSIIIGHSVTVSPILGLQASRFVYLYHIMVFFFASGFCFNEEKYRDNIGAYFGSKLRGLIPKFFLYNLAFVLLHNVLCKLGVLPAGTEYSFNDGFIWALSGFLFNINETMLGAFWFVPVLLAASLIFGFLFDCSRKYRYSGFVLACGGAVTAVAGLYANHKGMMLSYHLQTALLTVPVMLAARLARKNWQRIEAFFNWKTCLLSATAMIAYIHLGGYVELSLNHTGDLWFYPVTAVGLCFCLSLARVLLRLPEVLLKPIVFVGRNSFHYMALHFLCFKLIDLTVVTVLKIPRDYLSAFPHSFELGFLYPLISVAAISALLAGVGKIRSLLPVRKKERATEWS